MIPALRLTKPLRFGFGVETWLGLVREEQVIVRRYFGPALDGQFGLLPDEFVLFRLSHPGIQHLLLSGNDDDGSIVQVFEWIEGSSLDSIMLDTDLDPRLTPIEFSGLFRNALGVLKYLHHDCPVKPIVHGDISPGNMILGPGREQDGRKLTIIDMKGHESGIKPSQGPWDSRESGIIVGTLPYMSDPVLRGDPVDGPAEIWSLAVSLTTVVAGGGPWKDVDSPDDMIRARKKIPATDLLDQLPSGIRRDSRLMSLLLEMMQPRPADRPTAIQCLETFS